MTASIRSGVTPFSGDNARLTLLFAQSLSLGITLSLLIITASALFLPEFGSEGLPYVYIAVAVLASGIFYGFAELQKRWTVPRLSMSTITATAIFFLLTWLGLTLAEFRWVPFLLLVSFSLFIQLGFVILGIQAGRLFDVRQLKRLFPRIVAGFVAGFLIGGFIAPPLTTLLGGTENVILAVFAGTLCLLALVIMTDRRYHEELTQVASAGREPAAKPLTKLITQRFVLLIVLYQMLAIIGSQLLDFMVFAQAAARFPDSQALTQFLSNYIVAINISDLLFLILFAGLLLSRYGLNLGLLVNPVVDILFLLAMLVIGLLVGPVSTSFFMLLVVARIIDITLTDGMRRGSINTTYQALPANDRVPVQTGVEGIAAPVALGLTGIILLIFARISGLTILHIVFFTLLIVVLWAIFGALTYRDYATALRRTLRRRALGPAELTLDDSSSLAVVEKLLKSDSLSDVRLALDMLEGAEHESLNSDLIMLTEHRDPHIRREALGRIERSRIETARPAVQHLVDEETDPSTKGAALRALCALSEADAVERVLPYLDDPNSEVAMGAAAGLLQYGGTPGVLAAGERLQALEASTELADRLFIARVIGQVGSQNFYQPLVPLLDDEDPLVRTTALAAAANVKHPQLIPLIINNLARPGNRSAAMTALVANGEAILPYVEKALVGEEGFDQDSTIRLIRACGQVRGQRVIELLVAHIEHADPEIRYQVLLALNIRGYVANVDDVPAMVNRLQVETNHAARVLITGLDVGENEAFEPLQRALQDELHRDQQRVFLLLSFIHDARTMIRAMEQLLSSDSSQSALAMEVLDVTLPADQKRFVFPLIDPQLNPAQRAQQLGKLAPIPHMASHERLQNIIADPHGQWANPWTRACAIYAAGKLGHQRIAIELAGATEAALQARDAILRETAAWALHRLAPDRYQIHAAQLLADPDPQVARLAAQLTH